MHLLGDLNKFFISNASKWAVRIDVFNHFILNLNKCHFNP